MQLFVSHTRHDENFCDRFDRVIAREEGISAFRSELEDFGVPQWRTLREEMEKSCAMFLLVGPELVRRQDIIDPEDPDRISWRHTQNWISFEIGLACMLGLDVWVFCDDTEINFPVPYLNNYYLSGLKERRDFTWLRSKILSYIRGEKYPFGYVSNLRFVCTHETCGSEFNLQSMHEPTDIIRCPSCLREIQVLEGKYNALTKYLAELEQRASGGRTAGPL